MSDWKNVQYKDGKMRTSEGGGGGGSSTFAGLDDVDFSNPQNGQVPKYNSTTQKWENANESGGGGTVTDVEVDGVSVVNQQGVAEITMPSPPSVPDELSDLSDVQFSNLTDHQPLRYNATSQKWVNGADNYPPLIYSDEEREVGVWRDGKPLYQRTFTVTINANAEVVLDTNIEFCFLVGNSYIQPNQVVSEQYIGSGVTAYCYVNTTLVNGVWTLRLQNMHNGQLTYCVTVRYTKTTDTAGSGTWTTQGGYAHHYSTTEHVVGTWIDNKPLYERTFVSTSSSVGTPVTWDISGINIDKVIKQSGSWCRQVISSSDKYWYDVDNVQSTDFAYLAKTLVSISENLLYSTIEMASGNTVLYRSITLQYTKTTDV